jgi:hypothetical protein
LNVGVRFLKIHQRVCFLAILTIVFLLPALASPTSAYSVQAPNSQTINFYSSISSTRLNQTATKCSETGWYQQGSETLASVKTTIVWKWSDNRIISHTKPTSSIHQASRWGKLTAKETRFYSSTDEVYGAATWDRQGTDWVIGNVFYIYGNGTCSDE